MEKLQTAGVQEMAPEAEVIRPFRAVKRVPYNGMASGREVNTDLMRHAGLHLDLQQTQSFGIAQLPKSRQRLPASRSITARIRLWSHGS